MKLIPTSLQDSKHVQLYVCIGKYYPKQLQIFHRGSRQVEGVIIINVHYDKNNKIKQNLTGSTPLCIKPEIQHFVLHYVFGIHKGSNTIISEHPHAVNMFSYPSAERY